MSVCYIFNCSSNEKLEGLTQVIHDKIKYYFPKRTVKFHVVDKPFITGKIENLVIKRNRAFHIDKKRHRFLRTKELMKSGKRKENILQ